MTSDPSRGLLFAAGAALGIAGFVVPWKLASRLGSAEVNTLLLLLAAASFNTLLRAAGSAGRLRISGFDLRFSVLLALLTLAGNLASAAAIQELSPAVLTVVQRSEVILVALLAWPLIGERVEGRFWWGAGVAGAGLLLLQDPFEGARVGAAGMLWAALSALCFSAMAVVTRKVVHRLDLVAVNALRLWLSVGVWFAFYGWPEELGRVTALQVLWTSLAALCGPFLGRLSMMAAARHLPARTIALVTLAAPPITLVLAWVSIGDLPEAREIQGGLLMLLGIAIPILGAWRAR